MEFGLLIQSSVSEKHVHVFTCEHINTERMNFISKQRRHHISMECPINVIMISKILPDQIHYSKYFGESFHDNEYTARSYLSP